VAHLLRLTDVEGSTVVDVGCGQGALVRTLAALGAAVTGVEISEDRVAAVEARPKVNKENYAVGTGENVPAPSGSVDLVTYLFSLHHVPAIHQSTAIAEAARILRPGGKLHVAEPLPSGQLTEVLAPIEDERAVRHATQDLLEGLDGAGWTLLEKTFYETERPYADLDAFIRSAVLVDPARTARLDENRETVANRFDRLSYRRDGLNWLRQPCVMFHLTQACQD